ncbi:MAG: phenylacetate-CoA oxygenase subunit PaaI [Flavobacteriales bacterium]|nr:phenylacetate-CoA oxygenase subunit PaaI [Flavobacteriales bacterium]
MSDINKEALYDYLLLLGDNSMILGQRLGELCGHGPELETDIALTNISLDLFGQVRNYFQYAAEVVADGRTEDDIAMLRKEHEYKSSLLVEQPNTDFAYVIVRQNFFDHYHYMLLSKLVDSKDEQIVAVAKKSIKEVEYHLDFSSTWVKRLGDGTEESRQRMQDAVNELYRFTRELFKPTETEERMANLGIGADLPSMEEDYYKQLHALLEEATLEVPQGEVFQYGGKEGRHSEYMGYILTDFQFMQRAYPNMKW